jgi:hypothetical protein
MAFAFESGSPLRRQVTSSYRRARSSATARVSGSSGSTTTVTPTGE